MDASGMVTMAQKWKNVGPQVQSAVKASIGKVKTISDEFVNCQARVLVLVHGPGQIQNSSK